MPLSKSHSLIVVDHSCDVLAAVMLANTICPFIIESLPGCPFLSH